MVLGESYNNGEYQDKNNSLMQMTSRFIPTAWATNISQRCIDDSRYYIEALTQTTEWAMAS